MQKLSIVDAETLLYEPLDKPSFVVDGLIPTGLTLFCGSQKIGKSWLMLKLCLCVSQGLPLWDMPTRSGDVLYLCLEDTFFRIQDRLFRLTNEADKRLHFAVASCKLSDGLLVQLEEYLKEYPDSRLIVIDTLQRIRTASKDNAYANDYGDLSLVKDFPTGTLWRLWWYTISVSRMTAILGYPPLMTPPTSTPFFYPKRQAEDKARQTPCSEGVQRESLSHAGQSLLSGSRFQQRWS